MKKSLGVIFLSAAFATCNAEPIGIGFIEPTPINKPNAVILYSSQELDSNSTVDFEYKLSSGQTKCCQRISGSAFKETQATERVSAMGAAAQIYTYTASMKSLSVVGVDGFISTAVINADSTEKTRSKLITARKSHNEFTIERCYGTEGINLYRKKNGTTLEHLYFYLNYDIDPTCP